MDKVHCMSQHCILNTSDMEESHFNAVLRHTVYFIHQVFIRLVVHFTLLMRHEYSYLLQIDEFEEITTSTPTSLYPFPQHQKYVQTIIIANTLKRFSTVLFTVVLHYHSSQTCHIDLLVSDMSEDLMHTTYFILTIILALSTLAIYVDSFNVPPTGQCFVPSGGNCFRCDCYKQLKCYKGTCR
uniref:Laminin EGF-like domain-containing protein n=1 Tax=Heterorhabditis bacteriophora TaxID=37862 RepID=A0A1I7X644_HETBA